MRLSNVLEKATNKSGIAGKWRNMPTWQVIALLILCFPIGLYLLWIQDRWSKHTKKTGTWITSAVVAIFLVLVMVFAPPTVTVTSSLAAVKSDSYQLTGRITPSGSAVTVNGVQAKVTGDTFSANVRLKEGDNKLTVVATSGSKHTEQVFKIHRFTQSEVLAQEKAAAQEKADEDAAAKPDATTKPDTTAKVSAPVTAPAPKVTITVSQKNALQKAKDYLSYTAFSHDGLVDQLEYEQFSTADATYGADNVGANWNEQAAKKAKDYMDYSSFSRGSLIDQLEYEKFTPEQAIYGADAVGL